MFLAIAMPHSFALLSGHPAQLRGCHPRVSPEECAVKDGRTHPNVRAAALDDIGSDPESLPNLDGHPSHRQHLCDGG